MGNTTAATFREQLAAHGPAASGQPLDLAEAQAYCRRLARAHYENFTVASWLLPRRLRDPFYALYAYCRWSDDLADETGDPQESLRLLDWWESQLARMYAGEAEHPVFIALRQTVADFAIPIEPLRDLLVAFRRDQTQTRYETFADLCEYCRYSANPVGRLVLYLGRCHDDATGALADSICTGLQLANHWQDVARDYQRGRIYLPKADMQANGVSEAMLSQTPASPAFRQLLKQEVEIARRYLEQGWPLVRLVPRELQMDVRLFIEGGLAILDAIRRADYDVLSRRPVLSKWRKLQLAGKAWLMPLPAAAS